MTAITSINALNTVKVFCFDESCRSSTVLPDEFNWSDIEENSVLGAPLGAAVIGTADDLRRLRCVVGPSIFSVLPLIGLSRELLNKVDVVVGGDTSTIAGALTALRSSSEGVKRLPSIFAKVTDGALHLLAHLAVREIRLAPVYTSNCASVAHFQLQTRLGEKIEFEADRLATWGLLEPRFEDRINVCSACASARIIVRELCPACQSAQIQNESIIHHFRCAEEAPESHFRRGTSLVCPKCRQHLRHFSVDYDKPGMVVSCGSCGHITGEPCVGFRCLDCGRNDQADRLLSREIRSYDLTDTGRANIFDESWLADFVEKDSSGAQSLYPNPKALMTADDRSDTSLIEFRFARHSGGWRWLRPATKNLFDLRARELTQRLVREYFADNETNFVDLLDGFDALIGSELAVVERQLLGLEQRIKRLVDLKFTCSVRATHLHPGPPSLSAA